MIDNLEEKLKGTIPVNRAELLELISSWGRNKTINISLYSDDDVHRIIECKKTNCYDLSKLDTSKITDMSYLFMETNFNGDISKWNTSSCIKMDAMFWGSKFNNDSLKNWDISNVKYMDYMFTYSPFNQDISNLDISNVLDMDYMFYYSSFDGDISNWKFNSNISCEDIFSQAKNFIYKYNNNNEIPDETPEFIQWFEENKMNIKKLNISNEEKLEIDDYLSNFYSDKELINDK